MLLEIWLFSGLAAVPVWWAKWAFKKEPKLLALHKRHCSIHVLSLVAVFRYLGLVYGRTLDIVLFARYNWCLGEDIMMNGRGICHKNLILPSTTLPGLNYKRVFGFL